MVSFSLFGKTFEVLGYKGFFLAGSAVDMSVLTMFLFQMVFMDTALTIPTGSMAERWKFKSFIVFSLLLSNFSAVRLIQVIQGAAAASVVLNFIATWKQEARRTRSPQEKRELERPFSESWAAFRQDPRATRLLVTVALGTLGFSMQDIIL